MPPRVDVIFMIIRESTRLVRQFHDGVRSTQVPKKVDQLFKALKHHDRRAFASGQDVDYLTPIVADGDTGHGGLTAVMKLTQLMVEAGAAGVHFEDQSAFRVVISSIC